jgi:hypothetical protein
LIWPGNPPIHGPLSHEQDQTSVTNAKSLDTRLFHTRSLRPAPNVQKRDTITTVARLSSLSIYYVAGTISHLVRTAECSTRLLINKTLRIIQLNVYKRETV